jgi:hypothetical protein
MIANVTEAPFYESVSEIAIQQLPYNNCRRTSPSQCYLKHASAALLALNADCAAVRADNCRRDGKPYA